MVLNSLFPCLRISWNFQVLFCGNKPSDKTPILENRGSIPEDGRGYFLHSRVQTAPRAHKLEPNSAALVRERTIPTEQPRLLAKLLINFADRGCRVVSATDSHGRWSRFSRPEPLLLVFLSSSSAVVFTRLSGPRSRPAASQKIWKRRESNLGPLDL
jgi:hypothetical protein